jgi:RNA polymerase sigma-70 factor (ECF subfamily)
MTSLTNFINTLQMGLGASPDFAPRRVFRRDLSKIAHLSSPDRRPSLGERPIDPDAGLVAKVRNGDLDVFEELINRHSRRVYRTLVGILGNDDEARDAMQDTFLKAFQHLGEFQQRSKFSTWLVSIASNTGLQRLRDRKHVESLDEDGSVSEEGFRPREVRAWIDDPEELCSKAEIRALVENSVMKLPAKYRVVVVLRDLEQLSIEETAEALGLGIPALKARHMRGRLMVREALSPHFTGGTRGVAV